jgi:hypothetical protein
MVDFGGAFLSVWFVKPGGFLGLLVDGGVGGLLSVAGKLVGQLAGRYWDENEI